ncbi:4Fe-4S dicluster domain-containing protein, partial [bacterium]|nr:4Fe-4S dicluster domain-containing protein [bacterium]
MESMATLHPSTLSTKDLHWRILWSKEKCTLCGRCTAVCPVQAIELGVHRKRTGNVPLGIKETPGAAFSVY